MNKRYYSELDKIILRSRRKRQLRALRENIKELLTAALALSPFLLWFIL